MLASLLPLAAAALQCAPEACTGNSQPSCPTATRGLASKPQLEGKAHLENIYFRNAAPHTVEILHVDQQGDEVSTGFLSPGLRRLLPTLHGDVWRVRALRPGHPGDQRLLLEHRVGTVELKDCECPQPSFVDCKKPPFMGPRNQLIDDPVVFENFAPMPVDLYYWNGTCEELVSWNDVGGVQMGANKRLLSTQGHSFRARDAFSGRMLMQHTLNDLVVRGCDEEEERERSAELAALQQEVWSLEAERDTLREGLAAELSRLIAEMGASAANATTASDADAAKPNAHSDLYAIAAGGAAKELRTAGSMLGALFATK